MSKEEIINALKSAFPDWDVTTDWDELAQEVIDFVGIKTLDLFALLGWQEQDNVINVLTAIKGS